MQNRVCAFWRQAIETDERTLSTKARAYAGKVGRQNCVGDSACRDRAYTVEAGYYNCSQEPACCTECICCCDRASRLPYELCIQHRVHMLLRWDFKIACGTLHAEQNAYAVETEQQSCGHEPTCSSCTQYRMSFDDMQASHLYTPQYIAGNAHQKHHLQTSDLTKTCVVHTRLQRCSDAKPSSNTGHVKAHVRQGRAAYI